MAQVITFEDFTPIARYDETPWTLARIEEAASDSGPWTQIDELTLDPVDDDPENPQSRNLTTELASSTADLWYRIIFVDGTGDISAPTDPIQNTGHQARDLCTLTDVYRYAPGFDPSDSDNARIVAQLRSLITAQSQLILDESGREIVARGAQPATRKFDISRHEAYTRRVEVGDLQTTSGLAVRLLGRDLDEVSTYASDEYLPLYPGFLWQPTETWEPIIALRFPWSLGGAALQAGHTLEVTGTFGFPAIPQFIRDACAGRVVLRYNDVTADGDAFSEAIDTLDAGVLFRSSQDAIDRLHRVVMA